MIRSPLGLAGVLLATIVGAGAARGAGVLDGADGVWAIGNVAACVRSPYELVVSQRDGTTIISFRDRDGKVNDERVDAEGADGITTTTLRSTDVAPGTRWRYAAAGGGVFTVRNLTSGRQFNLVRCLGAANPQEATPSIPAPAFTDPVALISWLIANSGRGFAFQIDAATANVFSPGLRAALRASFARSRRDDEPPCGAHGDIILSSQESGTAQNLRLSATSTTPDRTTVAASFDIVGYHRDRRYLTVKLDGIWKLENILEADGQSLRRSLACQ